MMYELSDCVPVATTLPEVDSVSHTKPSAVVIVVTHVWSDGQGVWVSHTSVYWQRWPVKPWVQLQKKEPLVSVHVPPFWQGAEREKRGKNKKG